ncbi:mechanosensitive channel protein MscS [Halobacterium hubeiense]|uniref:Mechanosensitive channel protein MscS n=1 Tax=Halobacterium hubeiense TaxID=1407499 RepID=A0A0U5CZ15_9EURY|nr:mechanosensitive ion channel family protein [Halobacterium hubeiense]CQH58611.1 mechanosensitive channel protein MscS [Halobacterium hubeiense]
MSAPEFVDVAINDLSTVERVAVTVVSLAALVAAVLFSRRESARRESRLSTVAAAVGAFAVVVVTTVVVVVAWDAETIAWAAVASFQVQATMLVRAFLSVMFLVGVYVGTGVIHRAVSRFVKRTEGISEHQAEITYRIIQISVYVIALVIVLNLWGIKLGGLLIGAGFAGIVLGMAARQTLGAVIAGLVLMFSRPFEIGDWVKIGDKDGIVTDITIVNTRLQTFDGEYVMLPNDLVGSDEVVNRSRKGRLRIHVEVGIDYTADVDEAMSLAKDAMGDVDDILTVPRPQVVLKEFGDSAVVLDLRFWIDKPSARRKWRAQTAVISAVKSAFDEAGVKIPFPQREVSGRAETGGFRVSEQPTVEATEPEDADQPGSAVRKDSKHEGDADDADEEDETDE